jgi:tripartite-type tricarboxylate transporter receptor subunit TctC
VNPRPMTRREWLLTALASAGALPLSTQAQQQAAYPYKSINWVVGFPPGGGSDAVTRIVAGKAQIGLGQPIVVENRPGASSIIAAQYVLQAPADGYTLLSAEQGVLIFNEALYAKIPYDPARDFIPITNMVSVPLLLVVNPEFPARDLRSFIDLVKKNPGKYNFGSPGRGLAHHLAMEKLKAQAGLEIMDVQYKGIGPVIQDVVAGQIPIGAIDLAPLLPQLRTGKLRAIASFSTERLAILPDVPTFAEIGLTDLDLAPIVGVVAARGTPPAVITRVHDEVVRALHDEELVKKMGGLGIQIVGNTPEQFSAFLKREAERWLPFIRSRNIRLE